MVDNIGMCVAGFLEEPQALGIRILLINCYCCIRWFFK